MIPNRVTLALATAALFAAACAPQDDDEATPTDDQTTEEVRPASSVIGAWIRAPTAFPSWRSLVFESDGTFWGDVARADGRFTRARGTYSIDRSNAMLRVSYRYSYESPYGLPTERTYSMAAGSNRLALTRQMVTSELRAVRSYCRDNAEAPTVCISQGLLRPARTYCPTTRGEVPCRWTCSRNNQCVWGS